MTVRARGVAHIMVLPDYIVEAVDRLPGDDGWGQIRAYLDAGGDRDAILDAYAKATNTNWHPDISGALARQKRARQEREGI